MLLLPQQRKVLPRDGLVRLEGRVPGAEHVGAALGLVQAGEGAEEARVRVEARADRLRVVLCVGEAVVGSRLRARREEGRESQLPPPAREARAGRTKRSSGAGTDSGRARTHSPCVRFSRHCTRTPWACSSSRRSLSGETAFLNPRLQSVIWLLYGLVSSVSLSEMWRQTCG